MLASLALFDVAQQATLQVGKIRGLSLDVKPDTEPDPDVFCDHGNIIGVPFQTEDPVQAEYFATELAKLVQDVWRP